MWGVDGCEKKNVADKVLIQEVANRVKVVKMREHVSLKGDDV